MTVFLDFESFETISSGQFYAEDFSSFDNLEFIERAKRSAENFTVLDIFAFHFGGEFFLTVRVFSGF